jgi:hypothetical protein
LFEELSSTNARVKYGAVKALLNAAKEDASGLYPHAAFFEKLLDSDNNILKWTAIDIIGYMASADADHRIAKTTDTLVSFLSAGKLIAANHAIAALARFAAAFPDQRERITRDLMTVEHCVYDTDECRNIALGNVIVALDSYFAQVADKRAVVAFVERQTANTRNATAKKAQAFLKKHATRPRA